MLFSHLHDEGCFHLFKFFSQWDAVSELRHCVKDLNIKGLKLHGWWHQFPYSDHILLGPLFEICNEYNLPVLMYVMGDNPLTSPLQVEEMAKSFPNMTFVMSHGRDLAL
jgi:predicted TIM-barrel fold metal-dependent hydrolase